MRWAAIPSPLLGRWRVPWYDSPMPRRRLSPTLADYVALAICPALIMTMVGSLVFFLLEVLYVGQYQTRLRWVFACFVFATVLIARISMRDDTRLRAPLYGVLLALPTFFATIYFIEYQTPLLQALAWPINIAILAIIWWSAHKLTYDCTYEDEATEASGKGLLQAAGLEPDTDSHESSATVAEPLALDEPDSDAGESQQPDGQDSQRPEGEPKKKRHTPGVWIVYFSLAALPLFGLGQLLLPAAKRGYGSGLLAVYVASGLGLLLCTSFLNLRRYLRERKVSMPSSVTAAWLVMGGVLIAALVGIGLVLPWPSPEGMAESLGLASSKDRQASRYAVLRDGAAKGQGARSRQGAADPQAKSTGNRSSDSSSDRTGQGQTTSQGQQGSENRGNSQRTANDSSRSNANSSASAKNPSSSRGEQQRPTREGNQDRNPSQQNNPNSQQNRSQERSNPGAEKKPPEGSEPEESGSSSQEDSREADMDFSQSASSPQWQFLEGPAQVLGMVLKWIALAVGVVVGLYFLVRFLANFSAYFKGLLAFLDRLFGRKPEEVPQETAAVVKEAVEERLPFAAFSNPFLTGAAERWAPAEVVRYSFEALEAWAAEHGLARRPEETPLEFAHRVGDQVRPLALSVRRLADLFVRMNYARQMPTKAALPVVREFWTVLTETPAVQVESPAPSAGPGGLVQ